MQPGTPGSRAPPRNLGSPELKAEVPFLTTGRNSPGTLPVRKHGRGRAGLTWGYREKAEKFPKEEKEDEKGSQGCSIGAGRRQKRP